MFIYKKTSFNIAKCNWSEKKVVEASPWKRHLFERWFHYWSEISYRWTNSLNMQARKLLGAKPGAYAEWENKSPRIWNLSKRRRTSLFHCFGGRVLSSWPSAVVFHSYSFWTGPINGHNIRHCLFFPWIIPYVPNKKQSQLSSLPSGETHGFQY